LKGCFQKVQNSRSERITHITNNNNNTRPTTKHKMLDSIQNKRVLRKIKKNCKALFLKTY